MEMAAQEIITDKTINQVFQRALNARGWVDGRAYEIKHEMARIMSYAQAAGLKIIPKQWELAEIIREKKCPKDHPNSEKSVVVTG